MAANKSSTRNIVGLSLFGFLAVLASFLFSNLLTDLLYQTQREEHPVVPEECIQTITIVAVTLNCLSLFTFPFLVLGIYRLKTWLVLPWSLVNGFQTLIGGFVLWYLVYQTDSATLFQCLSLYALVAYGFIGITFCYFKLKSVDEAKKQILIMDKEKAKIIVF